MTTKNMAALLVKAGGYVIFASMNARYLLIVDDSPIIISRLKSMLEGLPGLHSIRVAGSYAEALPMISAIPSPDLLLLDINLPDRNGIELLRYVHQQHPGIRVIMISNQGGVFYRDLCLRLGAAHYIDKSTEFELVPTLVSSLLKDSL